MKNYPVGIRSLALNFPRNIRTNDYYRQKYPELVSRSEQKSLARLFSLTDSTPSNEFEQEMMPYLADPFRGAVERRILAPGETSLTLEYGAAREALEAAKLAIEDIDLAIVTSFGTDEVVAGNAAFLVNELGLHCPAWNLNSMCSSGIVAMQTASTLVRAGEYRNILVVTSCAYSRLLDERDTLSWITGDSAAAFVISELKPQQGILSSKIVHSAETCGIFHSEIAEDVQGNLRLFMKTGKGANRVISNTATDFVLRCCEGAATAAKVAIGEIDFFIFNTPTAWFTKFAARVLGINPERTINLYPQYGNIGPVLPLANLYHAALSGKIHENDLVLIYSFGASANATATVMRWGDVALGTADFFEKSSIR
ncbi:3-oxoacyl-[acyl-carrier-protein] synthase III (plasmid) [Cylindrospermum sp. NIES-4074]|nr:3-oxoacyl-[acyl-carrier-protein] synthase III [Cylindrospermum sp. NIES-4074]